MKSYLIMFSKWLDRQYQYSLTTKKRLRALVNRISAKINLDDVKVTERDVEDYIEFIQGYYSSSSQKSIIWALRKFMIAMEDLGVRAHWLYEFGKLPIIRNHKTNSHQPYEDYEIKEILSSTKGLLHQILWIAFHTGLRKTEIQNLKVSDIDLVENCIYVRRGKFNISRKVYLVDTKPLENWLYKRKIMNIKCPYWLFSSKGKRIKGDITRSGVSLADLSHRLGFNVTLHRCRTTYATHIYNHHRISFRTVKDQLGHLVNDMTAIYIQPSLQMRKSQISRISDLYQMEHRETRVSNTIIPGELN